MVACARSAWVRLLLAVLVAVWSPACRCWAQAVPPAAPADQASCCCCEDSPGQDRPSGPPVPCHDGQHPTCSCRHTDMMLQPALDAASDTPVVLAVLSWAVPQSERMPTIAGQSRAGLRAPARPTTALLRLHCALTV